MIRERFFSLLTSLATSGARRAAYLLAAGLTVGAVFHHPQLEIQTTRQGMVSEDVPVQADLLAYMREFGTPTQLVMMLEGSPDEIRPAADAVAKALAHDPEWVRNVVYRVDMEAFRRAGLYYLSTDDLSAMRDFLAADPERTEALLAGRNLAGLLAQLEGLTGAASLDSLSHPAVDQAEELLDAWGDALRDDADSLVRLDRLLESAVAGGIGGGTWLDPEGYFLSDDGRLAFLFVQQAQSTDETGFIVPFVDHVRATAAEALHDHPGVTFGVTGWPAAIAEDHAILLTDLPKISLIATVVILALFLAAFRSFYRMVLVMIPLVCGVIWTLGLTVLTVGHLNYLSSVFVGILFGLGMDFGIYFIRRFDEERLKGAAPARALHRTLSTAGLGIVTGGLTTIAAFFAIGVTDQPAFSELGIVAGLGVASVLLATLLLLPPLLVQHPPGMRRVGKEVSSPWLETAASAVLGRPVPVAAALVVVVLVCAAMIPRLGFDYNLNNLLPANGETVRVLRTMAARSPFSDQFIAVIADDLSQVRRLHQVLEELGTVARVESLAAAIPSGVEDKRPLMGAIAALLPESSPAATVATDPRAVRSRLGAFTRRLEEAEEDAFASGQTEAMLRVADLRSKLDDLGRLLQAPEAGPRLTRFARDLFDQRDELVEQFSRMLSAEPITLSTLDPSIADRFVGRTGKHAVLVFPTQPIWDPEFLDLFVLEVREASRSILGSEGLRQRVTGFAVTYQVSSRAIRVGFAHASWAAALVVVLMLLADLRRPAAVMLALAPLATTFVLLLGGMAAAGIQLTMATQVAFPILLGLGVAYGVHMVHRLGEPDCADPAHAVGTTGKAISLAAATTMAGFGAMMLAEHTALAGLGALLFLGILSAVVTALFLVPLLARLLSR